MTPSYSTSNHESSKLIGIDLGTTTCSIARLVDDDKLVCYPLEGPSMLLPSALYFGERIEVGRRAYEGGLDDPDSLVEAFKRDMGEPHFHRKIRHQWVPPEVLSALLLDEIRVRYSKQEGGPVKAVITVPAYFDERRRKATFEAGRLAGLEVLDIVNEPVAAALAEFFQQGLLDGDERRAAKLLVYDLGGGTFDVSVLDVAGTEVTTLASDGNVRLGGRDFDEKIVDFVAERFRQTHGIDPRADFGFVRRLWSLAEKAKHELTEQPSTTIVCAFAGMRLGVEITREEFEELIEPYIEQSIDTAMDALAQAGLTWADIDQILLVGGSSRIPAIAKCLKNVSQKEPVLSQAPDLAVCMGAALFAAKSQSKKLAPLKVINVNAHSLGIAGVNIKTGRPANRIIIPRNSRLPATNRQVFVTRVPNQRSVDVKIVEGENEDPTYCVPIGKCIVSLSPGLPERTKIFVTCRVSTNGTLSVSCHVPDAQEGAHVEIRRDGLLDLETLPIWRDRLLRGVSQPQQDTPSLPQVAAVAVPDPLDIDQVVRRVDYLCQELGESCANSTVPPELLSAQRGLLNCRREYLAIQGLLKKVQHELLKSHDMLERARLQSITAALRVHLAESERMFLYSRIAFGARCAEAHCSNPSTEHYAEEVLSLRQEMGRWQPEPVAQAN